MFGSIKKGDKVLLKESLLVNNGWRYFWCTATVERTTPASFWIRGYRYHKVNGVMVENRGNRAIPWVESDCDDEEYDKVFNVRSVMQEMGNIGFEWWEISAGIGKSKSLEGDIDEFPIDFANSVLSSMKELKRLMES